MASSYNILMYSHDTYGLGHIRRTMAIASHLAGPHTNVLIMTGSPLVGRFGLPEHIDFVRIPGMIKKTNEEYLPLSIKINPEHALDIRKNIIKTATKSFQPQLFIVDKEPLGLKREILPTLKWIKRNAPGARTILGLRDIMDEAPVVVRDWRAKNVYHLMDKMYDEIWVYGIKEIYDPVDEYGIPDEVSRKMTFTGYIPRKIPGKRAAKRIRKRSGLKPEDKMVAVTAGGGGDGYVMMDVFLTMLEKRSAPPPFTPVFVTGPFMPPRERDEITDRARRLGVRCWHFYRRMEEVLAAADLVVSMGGYNTVCELLTLGTVSLIIPREIPRREQLIRAKLLKERRLADYLPWQELAPDALYEKVIDLLERPEPYIDAIGNFELTGLTVMSERLAAFRNRP